MGVTKIINVLKDDHFEELLDIVKETEASEVIFVLPKTAKAFRSENHFAMLDNETKNGDKSVAFLCSNSEINKLAKKYNFDILFTKTESPKYEPVAIPITVQNRNLGDNDGNDLNTDKETDKKIEEYETIEDKESEKIGTEKLSQEEAEENYDEDYKEEKGSPEIVDEESPYGTKTDDDGNIVYDEKSEEEYIGEQISSANEANGFQILPASVKTRGLRDIVQPNSGKNLKVIQKDRRSIKIDTQKTEDDIKSVWGSDRSENIWSDIADSISSTSKSSFLNKFNLFRTDGHKFKKSQGFNLKTRLKKTKQAHIGILLAAFVFISAFVIYLTTGSAEVEIKPRAEKLNLQLKVFVSPDFSSIDTSFNRIPGQLFAINKSATDNFNATAEKDAIQKSRGTITIYNEYSTSPQPLVATTRFEYIEGNKAASEGGEPRPVSGRESGLVFRTLKTVSVPGMKVENGETTPGKINVEVIADKAGQNYNVPTGNFGIVTWREKGDTARYKKIYGISKNPMYGGISGKAKVVSEFDYNNAKNQLVARVNNEINETLKTQSAGLELPAGSSELKINPEESTVNIDNAADSFIMTVSGSLTTIGFKKDDLLSFISQYIDRTNSLVVVPEKLELSYKETGFNPINNIFDVVIDIKGNVYAKIEKDAIIVNLAGKDETQIKNLLGSMPEVDSAKVLLSPFWVKRMPKNREKINISLIY